MKTITTRRFLIPATLALALGLTGISVARSFDPNSPQPPPAASTMQKGRLGISVLPISEELRAKLGATRDRGVLVDSVLPDSPAARAGLRVGDVITAVDGDAVQSAADIVDAMSDRNQGQGISLAIVRDGRPVDLTATLDTDAGPRGPRGRRGPGGPRGPGGMMGGDDDFDVPGPGNGTWRWLEEPGTGRTDAGPAQQQIDALRKRLDSVEQRLEKLERR